MNITYSLEDDVTNVPENISFARPMPPAFKLSLTDTVCYKYVGPILCVFGVLGNVLSLLVLTRDRLKDAPYVYLRALAATDMMALLVSFPFMVFSIGSYAYPWKWYESYVFLPFANLFTASSVWITVTMSIERFIVVKFPLWAKWRCTRVGAKTRVCVILFTAFLLSIPRYFAYSITQIGSGYILKSTPFRLSEFYYWMDVFCIASFHFLPLLILGFINVFLIYEVQNARMIRRELNIRNNRESEFQKDQRRFTVTLISIVVLSLCFIVPATVSDIFMYTKFHRKPNGQTVSRIVRSTANVLLWCSLSFNFLLYCAFNRRFVRVMKHSLGRSFFKVRNYSRSKKFGRSFKSSNSTYL